MSIIKKLFGGASSALPKVKSWTTPAGNYPSLYKMMLEENHLLIAGATGSGKSVVLNGIIYTLLYKTPNNSRYYLIDPKRVELCEYRRLPHCEGYAETAADALSVLREVSGIMESRYISMQKRQLKRFDGQHIYIFIDELADLLLSPHHKMIEKELQHITQLGRAANIHLIAATQSPSRKTLPASFVLNMTGRCALRCDTAIESKQIINFKGAELLPAFGECLYKTPHTIGLTHYVVPMIPDEELHRVIDWWAAQK